MKLNIKSSQLYNITYGKTKRIKRKYLAFFIDIFIPFFWVLIIWFKDFFDEDFIYYYETNEEKKMNKLNSLNFNYINKKIY